MDTIAVLPLYMYSSAEASASLIQPVPVVVATATTARSSPPLRRNSSAASCGGRLDAVGGMQPRVGADRLDRGLAVELRELLDRRPRRHEHPALVAKRLPTDQRFRAAGPQRRRRRRELRVGLVVDRGERLVDGAHREPDHDAVEQRDGQREQQDHHDHGRNPWRRKAIELADQEAHQSADQLADFDEDEQHDDRQNGGQRVVPEPQPRHAIEVADVVLPDVEVDDHQDLADDADDHQRDPRPPRRGWAGVLRAHVAHQPHREHAEAVADCARRAADEGLEQRSARQQRRRQREPDEHQADRGSGEGVVALPPRRLGGVPPAEAASSVVSAGVGHERKFIGA